MAGRQYLSVFVAQAQQDLEVHAAMLAALAVLQRCNALGIQAKALFVQGGANARSPFHLADIAAVDSILGLVEKTLLRPRSLAW